MGPIEQFLEFVGDPANWGGSRGIVNRTVEHVRLSGLSVLVAVTVAVPPAMVLGHVRRGGVAVNAVVNIGRALPSLAILAFLFPLSLQYGLGLGFWPTFGALVLLAIPPMFTNTYAGVRDVDPSVVDASRGMGMRPREVLWRVEVPNALPLIITGLRVSSVQVVATATLGAFFGFNGLGSFIFEGFTQQDDGRLLTGAVAVALLAVATEVAFSLVERLATPWARTRRRRRRAAPVADDEIIPVPQFP